MRLALAQMNSVVGDLAGNRDRITARIDAGRTSNRPLKTLDTVGTDTPASRAIAVMVTRGSSSMVMGRFLIRWPPA